MYYGNIWMSAEMIDRHKGIATESLFALSMYRWVNKIIEFISLTRSLDEIGINELDDKISNAQRRLEIVDSILEQQDKDGNHRLFKRLKSNKAVMGQLA